MKDFVSHVSPSVICGLALGLLSVDIYLSMLLSFGVQYYFIRQGSDRKKEDGTDLGAMLGLSTVFYLPAAFIGYIIGKSILS